MKVSQEQGSSWVESEQRALKLWGSGWPTEPPEASSCCQKGSRGGGASGSPPLVTMGGFRAQEPLVGGWPGVRPLGFQEPRKRALMGPPEVKGGATGGLTGASWSRRIRANALEPLAQGGGSIAPTARAPEPPLQPWSPRLRATDLEPFAQGGGSRLGAFGYEPQPWSSASSAVAPPSISPRPTAPALEAQLQPWSP